MERKRTNSGSVGITVLLLIALIGVSGYVVYDKVFAEKEPKQEENIKQEEQIKQEEKEEVLDATSSEVTSLLNGISSSPSAFCGVWDYYKDSKVEVGSLSNSLVFDIALGHLKASGIEVLTTGTTFTASQVDQEIQKYFGKNYVFTHKTIESCPKFTYDASTQTYTVGVSGCGGICGFPNLKKIVSAVRRTNTIELGIRVLFVGSIESSAQPAYYQDYQKTKLLTDLATDSYGLVEETDANLSKGTLYKMVFTLEDGHYVFTSSEPVSE